MNQQSNYKHTWIPTTLSEAELAGTSTTTARPLSGAVSPLDSKCWRRADKWLNRMEGWGSSTRMNRINDDNNERLGRSTYWPCEHIEEGDPGAHCSSPGKLIVMMERKIDCIPEITVMQGFLWYVSTDKSKIFWKHSVMIVSKVTFEALSLPGSSNTGSPSTYSMD